LGSAIKKATSIVPRMGKNYEVAREVLDLNSDKLAEAVPCK